MKNVSVVLLIFLLNAPRLIFPGEHTSCVIENRANADLAFTVISSKKKMVPAKESSLLHNDHSMELHLNTPCFFLFKDLKIEIYVDPLFDKRLSIFFDPTFKFWYFLRTNQDNKSEILVSQETRSQFFTQINAHLKRINNGSDSHAPLIEESEFPQDPSFNSLAVFYYQ